MSDLPFPAVPLEAEGSVEGVLRGVFRHEGFRGGQREVVEKLLAGKRVLAVFPTGGGKSLCYQLPAVLMEGLTVVVSPLVALMRDQVAMLTACGVAAARLDSTLTPAGTAETLGHLSSDKIKILFLAPEQLAGGAVLQCLRACRIALMAIDEAHCISEWGHNFRPDYLRLAVVARQLRAERILALTATATPQVAAEIRKEFRIARGDQVQTPFHRPNLFLRIRPAAACEKLDAVVEVLRGRGHFPAIVYATLQLTTETVASALRERGFRARPYHAGLRDDLRAEIQDEFMNGHIDVVVATIAFGMGVDKSNVRAVIHFNLPKSLENYQQEIGRAGRDGLHAHCEALACADDLVTLQNFILGDTPDPPALHLFVEGLLRQGMEPAISHYHLSRALDIRPLVLGTALTYLEKEKILQSVGSAYSGFRIAFVQSEERLLSGHTAARRAFLKKIFATCRRGRKWVSLDVDACAEAIGGSAQRIRQAVQCLADAGDIEAVPSGRIHRYRLLDASVKPREVANRLVERFAAREAADLARLEKVVALAEGGQCFTAHLLAHFGDSLAHPCGHCARCDGEAAPGPLPKRPAAEVGSEALLQIARLRAEGHSALRGPRALARFLCGLNSPATTRDRLTRHNAFGLLAEVSFQEVLAHARALGPG